MTYTVIQLILFALFSIAVYSFVTGRFDVDAVPHGDEPADPEVILLRNGLIIFYCVLVVVIPLSSWLMARSALKPIKEGFARQQEFVDGASHEMRTPLSVIQGELELALTRSRTGAEYREAIGAALDATVGLSRLSDDLLRLSRTSSGELEATFVAVDIDSTVQKAIAQAAAATDQANVQVTFTPGESLPINGAPELLVRAIANVLENAIKFSHAGGDVTIVTAVDAGHTIVRVHDDGRGMTAGEAAHAFERFWRADEARATPGHGLGLALVDQIMDAHGGTASLESEVGRGTTVTLRIPTRP